jgi:hypothetical protein
MGFKIRLLENELVDIFENESEVHGRSCADNDVTAADLLEMDQLIVYSN